MSVDAARMTSILSQVPVADLKSTGPNASAGSAAAVAAETVETVASSSGTAAPRNWAWLKESVDQMRDTCQRKADLTTHSPVTLQWTAHVASLEELQKRLKPPPGVELQSLKFLPMDGQAEEHKKAMKLAQDTVDEMSKVAKLAGVGDDERNKDKRMVHWDVLELCAKIVLGLLATVGVATLGAVFGGPVGAFTCGALAAAGAAILVRGHFEHNQMALKFNDLKEFLVQLKVLVPEKEKSDSQNAGAPSDSSQARGKALEFPGQS
jgi:hypothetical protein